MVGGEVIVDGVEVGECWMFLALVMIVKQISDV
jgi:hypothetical protein